MEFYYSQETTSLKFHKAFYKVISPILIVYHAIMLLATIGHLVNNDGYYNTGMLVLNLFVYALAIIFLGYITYGFSNKKEYAWYMVYAYLILIAFSNLISVVLSYNVASAIGRVIGGLVLPIVIGIYYYKRKPLFTIPCSTSTNEASQTSQSYVLQQRTYQNSHSTTTHTTTIKPQNINHSDSDLSSNTQDIKNQGQSIQFCRKCGNKITISGSAFCNKCGAKLNWN